MSFPFQSHDRDVDFIPQRRYFFPDELAQTDKAAEFLKESEGLFGGCQKDQTSRRYHHAQRSLFVSGL